MTRRRSDLSLMELKHLLLTIMVIIGLTVLVWNLEHHMAVLEARLAGMGQWAGVGFVLVFVVLTPLFFSVDLLCVMAGALFSLPQAIAYMMAATLIAATVIFFIARLLAVDRVQRLLRRYPKLLGFRRVIGSDGVRVMFLLRVLPLPFAPMGYLFSATGVRFVPYLVATTGIFFYNTALIYFGYAARHLSSAVRRDGGVTVSHLPLIAGVGVAVVVLFLVFRVGSGSVPGFHICVIWASVGFGYG